MITKQCPQCSTAVEVTTPICRSCRFNFFSLKPNRPDSVSFQQTNVFVENRIDPIVQTQDFQVGSFRQLMGIAGAVVLFLGVFAPIVSVPIAGSLNYVRTGTGDGVVIILLAAVSAVLSFRKEFRGLIATGVLSLCMLGFTFFMINYRLDRMRSQVDSSNPFSSISNSFLDLVQIEWGWAVLVFGSMLVLAAGLMKRDSLSIQISRS